MLTGCGKGRSFVTDAWLFLVFLLVWPGLLRGASPLDNANSQPKRLENAKPGHCAVCHLEQKVLPVSHVNTGEMSFAQCSGCHLATAGKKPPGTLRGKMPLSHAHQLSGVTCTDCHEKQRPAAAPEGQKCLACHAGYKKIALTDKALHNPHDSHMGELDCLLCHHVHKNSENFCGQCHWWKYTVP